MPQKSRTLHQGQPVLTTGEPLDRARAAMVMLHGRGASAHDILSLADGLGISGFIYIAPQAARSTWYPNAFLAPIETNEPWLSSALALVNDTIDQIAQGGIPIERIMLLGFSQGACLALEFAARHARRYGGIAGLTGGLIGPEGTPRDYAGSFAGTPAFLGCSDVDFHIPKERVLLTADVYRRMDASVTVRLYPGMGHMVNQDEMDYVREMMASVIPNGRANHPRDRDRTSE